MLYVFCLIEICRLLWRWIRQNWLVTAAGLRAAESASIIFNCEGSPGSSAGDGRRLAVHREIHFSASVNLTTLFARATAFHTSSGAGGKQVELIAVKTKKAACEKSFHTKGKGIPCYEDLY